MQETVRNYFNISIIRDADADWIRLTLKEKMEILNYQIEMIANNPVNSILPISIVQKDNTLILNYETTSKLQLNSVIKEHKLDKHQIIHICRGIIKAISSAKKYLLYDRCFLLDEDFIYINPISLDVSLIYIPIELKTDVSNNMKNFIKSFFGKLKYDKEDYIQEILDYIDNEPFNIGGLDNILAGLKDDKEDKQTYENGVCQNLQTKNPITVSSKISIPKEVCINQGIKTLYSKNVLLAAGLVQVLLILAVSLVYKIMASSKSADASSLAGLIIIAGAIDYLITGKFLLRKQT